jgi:tetratricopeptide (TPR) repeat protein
MQLLNGFPIVWRNDMRTAAITIALIVIGLFPCSASATNGDVVLPLIKKSDVIAVIKIDDPTVSESHGWILRDTANPSYSPVKFKFVKMLRSASWCTPQLNVSQILGSNTQRGYNNHDQYLLFLKKGNNDQWWEVNDNYNVLRVEGESVRNARYYCKDLFNDPIETSSPPADSFDASVAEFEQRLKVATANIPETPNPKLVPPTAEETALRKPREKEVNDILEQQKFNERLQSWDKGFTHTDHRPGVICFVHPDKQLLVESLQRLSEVIEIRSAKHQLLDRAWIYIELGKPQEAINDVNASMKNPMRAPTDKTDNLGRYTYNKEEQEYSRMREYSTRAFAYIRMNQTEKALADCKAIGQIKPQASCDGFAVPALCWLRLGRYKTAKYFCDQVIEAPKGSMLYAGSFLYVIRARAYIGLKEFEKALKDCQQAITIQQGEHEFGHNSGNTGPSICAYWTLLGEPDCGSSLLARADALNCLHRYEEAKATVDQIIPSAPRLKHVCGIGLKIMGGEDKPATIDDVIKDGPARGSGLLAGDHIVAVDGKQTKGWSTGEIVKHITGPKGTQVTLSINRAGKPLQFTIKRTFEHLERFDSTPLLLRAYELRGQLCKQLGLTKEATQSFDEARELRKLEQH